MFEFVSQLFAVQLLPDVTGISSLPGLVAYVFDLALAAVGIAVFIQFLRAGWIWLTAAGNASKTNKAKELMTNAVLGLLILLSSYVILNIINPDLVKNTLDVTELRKNLGCDDVSCRTATNSAEILLAQLGIDWGNSDVSTMSQKVLGQIQFIQLQCGCNFSITYANLPGGERVDFALPAGPDMTALLATIDSIATLNSSFNCSDASGSCVDQSFIDNTVPAFVYRILTQCVGGGNANCNTEITMRFVNP